MYALSNNNKLVNYINTKLQYLYNHFSIHTDLSSTNIGKRYVRSDAIGVRLTITVDFQTLDDDTLTLRHSYNGNQDRINIHDIVGYVNNILT